jgi:hypothetical protein
MEVTFSAFKTNFSFDVLDNVEIAAEPMLSRNRIEGERSGVGKTWKLW